MYHTPECQRWALWALANLTTVYRTLFRYLTKHRLTLNDFAADKYCHLVEKEGGLVLLSDVFHHPEAANEIKQLAMMVVDNCWKFKTHDWQQELDG